METDQFLSQLLELFHSAETAVNGADAPTGTVQPAGNDNLPIVGVNALFL